MAGIARRDLLAIGAASAAATLVAGTGARAAAPDSLTRSMPAAGPGVPIPTALISTTSGKVWGLVNDGVHTFKGIRYGAAPVGPLRWMPPQRPKPSPTIIDCSEWGAPAMQMARGTAAAPQSPFGMQMGRVFSTPSDIKVENEDCLFLNVWTPATDNKARPVMFWIHGGGFAYGSSSQPLYDGEDLAREHDVVLVSINHRLNLFGYLDLSDGFGEAYKSSATVGMQDIVLALQWVRDNIAAFGGDPGNVTIMGQSGGGYKVSILLAMESAKGLFHKASIQSGPGLKVDRKDKALKATEAMLAELGIRRGDIAALQAVPAERLIEAGFAVSEKLGGPPETGGEFSFSPDLDGVVIARDPFTPDAPAVSADVPILIGYTKDELVLFFASQPWFGKMDEAQLKQFVASVPNGAAVVEALRPLRPGYSPSYLFAGAVSATFAMGGTIKLAEAKARQRRAPVYVWEMAWETPVANGVFKAPHCMEIPFMLDSYRRVRTFVGSDPRAANMERQIGGAWVAFARTGKPDCPAIPHWPAYDAKTRATMVFNDESRVVNDPDAPLRLAMGVA